MKIPKPTTGSKTTVRTVKFTPPRKPEFPLFPHSLWRPNLEILKSTSPIHDPWFKRDSWRYAEFFSAKNRLSKAFPGLGIATVLLSIYISFDFYSRNYGRKSREAAEWQEWLEKRNAGLHASHD
jgi:NADH-ubiquinone oxidoreductase B12 subunit family